METKDLALLAVTLVVLGEVTYLLTKLPRTTIKAKDRAILVDTSVLMDGRIIAIASTGFISGTLVIPRSVVGELQFLADNADADKRARARSGLDVVRDLQQMQGVVVELLQDGSKADEGVDERLLTLAKQHHADICTLDYNLNKVAVVEGIRVLNINELAQSMRMSHLPGEQLMIEVVQKGQDSHQGVGYLPDGTMVVIEQSGNMIGQQVHIQVVRSLQTTAGKMMFAKKVDAVPVAKPRKLTEPQTKTEVKATGRRSHTAERPSKEQRNTSNEQRRTKSSPSQLATPQVVLKPSNKPQQSRHQRSPKRKDHESSLLQSIQNQQ
ncbi:hypothetical protein EOL96_00140 [Candidatus Saccharibacteria bacterium]|nr:hypothetical protein [Candidatus Saccharibacteria bacterium]